MGRQRKFKEASRPVTVTLPESVLRDLALINPDRALAIAKASALATLANKDPRQLVEVVELIRGTGLLVIGPSRALRRIPFLHMFEVAPSRFLLALAPGHDSARLEVAIQDVFETLEDGEQSEMPLLQKLFTELRRLRRSQRLSMVEILYVDLSSRAEEPAGQP